MDFFLLLQIFQPWQIIEQADIWIINFRHKANF